MFLISFYQTFYQHLLGDKLNKLFLIFQSRKLRNLFTNEIFQNLIRMVSINTCIAIFVHFFKIKMKLMLKSYMSHLSVFCVLYFCSFRKIAMISSKINDETLGKAIQIN